MAPVKEETIMATKGKRTASHERPKALGKVPSGKPLSAAPADKPCQDYCALYPYLQWREADLTPSFNNRDNAMTPGSSLICVSGHLVDL
jgi:hypothetical protein